MRKASEKWVFHFQCSEPRGKMGFSSSAGLVQLLHMKVLNFTEKILEKKILKKYYHQIRRNSVNETTIRN